MKRWLPLLLILTAVACKKGDALGGIEVTLRILHPSTAQCARVYATGQDNVAQKHTDPIPRKPVDLNVAIVQSEDLGNSVTLEAHGYDDPMCSGPWTDDSNIEQQAFVRGEIVGPVVLLLDGHMHTDGGSGGGGGAGGGSGGGAAGGSVLPDGGPMPEDCFNGKDDDGDGKIDCLDPDCDFKPCPGIGNHCVNMMCSPTPFEMNCIDGIDNDNNGKTDCQEDACAGQACHGTDPCKAQVCTNHVCGGAAVVCNAPTSCQVANSGMCMADGGCGYMDRPGVCGDGGTCTAGACTIAFPFVPTNIPQNVPEPSVNGPLTLDCVATYDTDTGTWPTACPGQLMPSSYLVSQPNGAPVLRVLALRGLDVLASGALLLTGTQPLVLAVLGDANVAGRIDASAVGLTNGAGSPGNGCGASMGSPGVAGTTAGGGGAGHGGDGAHGGDDPSANNTGGARGSATANTLLSPLRGGCGGGLGAVANAVAAAEGGGGGGAFQLTVAGTLTISGKLLANGAGGFAGPAAGNGSGGGGGGSGGGILLEATTLSLTGAARVLAMGGGGGGGGQSAVAGMPGEDGHPNDDNVARGGAGALDNAGKGGDAQSPGGSATTGDNADGAKSGGGGGGAGVGRIVIHGTCSKAGGVRVAPDSAGSSCP